VPSDRRGDDSGACLDFRPLKCLSSRAMNWRMGTFIEERRGLFPADLDEL
jgi:hypothetical protein